MRPRRIPFGKDYIPSVVEFLRSRDELSDEDRLWAMDVLSEFFEVTSGVDDEWVVAARKAFGALEYESPEQRLVPFFRSDSPALGVNFDELSQLALRRRSIRWFLDKPVDSKIVEKALSVAAQSPSACNRQNIRFHVVYGREASLRLLDAAGGSRGFNHQVPCAVAVVGRLSGYTHAFDRHAIFIDGGLATMSFLLALETLGLGSCCINWPDQKWRYDQIRKEVPLTADEQIVMLIAVGEPDPSGMVPRSHKRSTEVLLGDV